MSSSLASLLPDRGTAASNGTFWIERPLDGGYEAEGPATCQSFWSWTSLVQWAQQNGVDLNAGWQKSEVSTDNGEEDGRPLEKNH
jgi:hypothetical protein